MIEIIIGIIVGIIAAEIIYWKGLLGLDSEGDWGYLLAEKIYSTCFGGMIGVMAGAITYLIKTEGTKLLLPAILILGTIIFVIINVVLKYKLYHSKKRGKK